jgi:hypothetical protein
VKNELTVRESEDGHANRYGNPLPSKLGLDAEEIIVVLNQRR